MTRYEQVKQQLAASPRTWLVTGCAGFIGSNIVERLLSLGQRVVGLDNFATGYRHNLDDIRAAVGDEAFARFRFVEGDIADEAACREACAGVDFVSHQAALGSVPRSIDDPMSSHKANVDGFVAMLIAARDAKVKRFVYASSSAVYGDHEALPKVEEAIGRSLSPYATTKYVNELYAHIFQDTYGIETVGLRYFNVFGPRQDPEGAYAAVIPRWIGRLLSGQPCEIYGDGKTSRDFCFVENSVQANILALVAEDPAITNRVYNVACGERTDLTQLYTMIRDRLMGLDPSLGLGDPVYKEFRSGDVRHSLASTAALEQAAGYQPEQTVHQGLDLTVEWFYRQARG